MINSYFIIGKSKSRDPHDYLEEEYVDLDWADLPSKTTTKESLKDTSREQKLKVAKTSKSFGDKKDKTTEGSGAHEVGLLNDDEDSGGNDDELTEGSGTEPKSFTSPIIHHEHNEVTKHGNKKPSDVKFGEFKFMLHSHK